MKGCRGREGCIQARKVPRMNKDRLFASKSRNVGDFAFDDAVADVFPDMISRSVPGYASILAMIGELAEKYARPSTNIYDLGCSLGAATFVMQNRVPDSSTIVAVDNSHAMLRRMEQNLALRSSVAGCTIATQEADIRVCSIRNASFVVLNLTLQFIPVDDRKSVLAAAFQGLVGGGAILLAEKLCFEDADQQALLTELHHDFKRSHGYSDLEIAEKRTAIENCLVPETLQTHISRLRSVGFRTVVPWFQCFSFASILAVKD